MATAPTATEISVFPAGTSVLAEANRPSFIETQFPVSRLSKESYKERNAKNSQTLTPLGKWWGRKPLIMVRAVILGLLMPASNDPRKDRDVFLALLTMDEDGLWLRKSRNIPLKKIYQFLSSRERREWFTPNAKSNRPKLKRGTKIADRQRLQRIVFSRMGYDEKLALCGRPEHVNGPSVGAWEVINNHLDTRVTGLPELVRVLGKRRFGHLPRVGDAFCGGGSVPFEAARLGCEAFGSDLNPVAALLTWGSLNIIGGSGRVVEEARRAQFEVFNAVDQQVTQWRIEHNEFGWRTDAFLYCTETICPECGWQVPLAPSWVVGEKPRTVARLIAKPAARRFVIDIHSDVDQQALADARSVGTGRNSRLYCPNCGVSTPISAIRGNQRSQGSGDHGLRLWENKDLVPRPDDTFQERLFCVRWRLPPLDALLCAEQGGCASPVPEWVDLECAIAASVALLGADEQREVAMLRKRDWNAENRALEETRSEFEAKRKTGRAKRELKALAQRVKKFSEVTRARDNLVKRLAKLCPGTLYRSVGDADLEREARTLGLLRDRFAEWQELGYIPSRTITPGYNTDQPIRERGWTHWHHLFTPRQLLTLGLFSFEISSRSYDKEHVVASILGLSRCADYNSKLCRWHTRTVGDKSEQTFSNQALNTMLSFAGRGLQGLRKTFILDVKSSRTVGFAVAAAEDARVLPVDCDIWLTDPPYADAVNYHELSEYLLAWHERSLTSLFPDWYADSKRALAVRGADAEFRRNMVDCYCNLAAHTPDDGFQVVMFTHQDASVWADLTLILWAAGLRVTAAWTIATETESALKTGNYVQGTVLMVLRKQTSQESAFSDEVVPEIEIEVERQLHSMLQLDGREDPNFSDADYQLAAYAAALRVLTKYASIEDIDIRYQLSRERSAGEHNPIKAIIEDAVRTASNFLVPEGVPNHLWRRLGPEEKLYLKGIEVESHGDFRAGVYQEFARGFGVRDYRCLLRTGKANKTRLKTASEFERRELGLSPFGRSLIRHALYAVWRAADTGDVADSLTWLHSELPDYWSQREPLTTVLRYLAAVEIDHWRQDAAAARVVAGAVGNDHV